MTAVRPTQCTLVPDDPEVLTSDQGWKLHGDTRWLGAILKRLTEEGIRTSLFLDPDTEQVQRAKDLGADRIELYTEGYARLFGTPQRDRVFAPYRQAALTARAARLGLNAGHDLDLNNLPYFARHIPGLLEVSIGHALICDALDMGLRAAVEAYLRALGYAEEQS